MDRSHVEGYWAKTRDWEAYRRSYFPDDENAKAHRRSRWFAESLDGLGIRSVLEIGCNCGRNLYHIQRRFPDIEIAGIDLNPDALAFARAKVKGGLKQGTARELGTIFDKKFDLVFSMAVMIHVAPEDIRGVLAQASAASQRWLHLVEYNGDGGLLSGKSDAKPSWRVSDQFLWTHDLVGSLRAAGLKPDVQPIPEEFLDVGLKDLIRIEIRPQS